MAPQTDQSPGDISADFASDQGRYDPGLDIDAILQSPAGDNLNWFSLVQARYALTGRMSDVATLSTDHGMTDAYSKEKGMKMDALFLAGQSLEKSGKQIGDALGVQQQAATALGGYWRDDTGASAQHKLQGLVTRGGERADEITALPGLIYAAVDEVKKCVQRKVDAFDKMSGVTEINNVSMVGGTRTVTTPVVGGRSSKMTVGTNDIDTSNSDDADSGDDDVSFIILYGKRTGIGDNSRKRIQQLADRGVFGPDAGGLLRQVTDTPAGATLFDDVAQAACGMWTDHFAESAEGYFGAYTTLCADTVTAIQQHLQTVADALHNVGRNGAPPQPAVIPAAPGNPAGGGSTARHGDAAGPRDATPGSGSPLFASAAAAPVPGAAAAAANNPLPSPAELGGQALQAGEQGLAQLGQFAQQGLGLAEQGGQQLAQAAQQGLGQLSRAAQQAAGQAQNLLGHGQPDGPHDLAAPMPVGAPGSKILADVTVPGGHLSITRASDGNVTATMAGPDGKPHSFAMGIKDGVPFIVPRPDGPPPPPPQGHPWHATPPGHGGAPSGSATPITPPFGMGIPPVPAPQVPVPAATAATVEREAMQPLEPAFRLPPSGDGTAARLRDSEPM